MILLQVISTSDGLMPLRDLPVTVGSAALPDEVRRFLRDAERRVVTFQRTGNCYGFVPSDFERVYRVLQFVSDDNLATGTRFCEWGCGYGVIACLAAMLGFDACGIEIDEELVTGARELAADFDLPVEFVHDSFIPRGGADIVDGAGPSAWLTSDEGDAYRELDLDVDDFDVVFAYPWPDEESVVDRLFDRFAAPGAVLATYHGSDDLRLRRKQKRRVSVSPR